MAIIEATTATFEQEVLQADSPVVVDFNATWCGPCRMLKPTLDAVAEARSDVKFVAVDVDDNSELAEEYGVFSIPCLILFKDGMEADRSVGLINRERLEAFIG